MSRAWLAGLIAAAKHDDERSSALYVVQAPTGAKDFTHFPHAFPHWFHVAQNAASRFVQSAAQPNAGSAIFQAIKPFVKGFSFNDAVHGLIVAFWLRLTNTINPPSEDLRMG